MKRTILMAALIAVMLLAASSFVFGQAKDEQAT
jgi:hypothetical protein